MSKKSGQSQQTMNPSGYGPGLSDPGPQLQLSAGGVPMPTGAPDFNNTSLGGQIGKLSPQMLEQIMAMQKAPQTPTAPAEDTRSPLEKFFDIIRDMGGAR